MSRPSDEEVLLRDYLLGNLDEAARELFEERLLVDDDFEERLSAAQDTLIDDYVFDALPASERESFDKNFIVNDERRRKILFARAVKMYVAEPPGPQPTEPDDSRRTPPPWKGPLPFLLSHKTGAAVSAFALLLLLLTPALLRWLRAPDEAALVRERRKGVERRVAELNRRPADESIKALPTSVLALQPNLLRDEGGIPRAILTGDIKLLTLKLAPPEQPHEDFKALVLTAEGEELFAVSGLTPEADGGAVPLNIPTEFLRTADYQIQLRAGTADDRSPEARRYYFRVIDKR